MTLIDLLSSVRWINGNRGLPTETFPEASKGKSRDKIGEKVGVSGKSVDKARTIKETATEIANHVLAGEVT